jgi:hypothetical protein
VKTRSKAIRKDRTADRHRKLEVDLRGELRAFREFGKRTKLLRTSLDGHGRGPVEVETFVGSRQAAT